MTIDLDFVKIYDSRSRNSDQSEPDNARSMGNVAAELFDETGGVSMDFEDWRIDVRVSNTNPLFGRVFRVEPMQR